MHSVTQLKATAATSSKVRSAVLSEQLLAESSDVTQNWDSDDSENVADNYVLTVTLGNNDGNEETESDISDWDDLLNYSG